MQVLEKILHHITCVANLHLHTWHDGRVVNGAGCYIDVALKLLYEIPVCRDHPPVLLSGPLVSNMAVLIDNVRFGANVFAIRAVFVIAVSFFRLFAV